MHPLQLAIFTFLSCLATANAGAFLCPSAKSHCGKTRVRLRAVGSDHQKDALPQVLSRDDDVVVEQVQQLNGKVVADSEEEEDIPWPQWSFQQFLSVMGGLLASLTSIFAYSQRKETPTIRTSPTSESMGMSSRSAKIVQQLGGALVDTEADSPLFSLGPEPVCTDASDLRRLDRHFTIITTAAIPWLTGTSVNPLLRALALAKTGRPVVLVLPWLPEAEQYHVFKQRFADTTEQEQAVFDWCRTNAQIDPAQLPLRIQWYEAYWADTFCCIFPTGDCSLSIGDGPRDVLILEEPEHLCWYHCGQRWPSLFKHVIGIIHTNYSDYVVQMGDQSGVAAPQGVKEATVFTVTSLVCSAYCDINIKLSDTIMPLPNEVTCNVHGVRGTFLEIGDRQGMVADGTQSAASGTAYYLGKALYGKGWAELLGLLEDAGDKLSGILIDGFGSGADYETILKRSEELRDAGAASLVMHPGVNHADSVIHGYGVLVNPSTTDVLCTVTVEALAMGKRCVLARHPSNHFFEDHFSERCHFFQVGDTDSFATALREALAAGPPQALSRDLRDSLTWEAATERLFDASQVRVLSGRIQRPSESAAARFAYRSHYDFLDSGVLADFVTDLSLGNDTPWGQYLEKWQGEQMEAMKKLREKAPL